MVEAATAADVPILFDVVHHRVYAGDAGLSDALCRAFATWRPNRHGPPKLHCSTQALRQRSGAHAKLVDPAELRAFLDVAPAEIPFDCMLEAEGEAGGAVPAARLARADRSGRPAACRGTGTPPRLSRSSAR